MIDLGKGEFVVSAWSNDGHSYCITNLGRTMTLFTKIEAMRLTGYWLQITGTKYYDER